MAGIDNGNSAAADDLEVISRADKRRCVLIQPDADGKGVVGERCKQPPQPVTLAEVLVNVDDRGDAIVLTPNDFMLLE